MVTPIDAVEALAGRSFDPALQGREAHVELAGDGAQAATPPDSRDHLVTPLLRSTFLTISASLRIVFAYHTDLGLLAPG
jgi:hypothetical protein